MKAWSTSIAIMTMIWTTCAAAAPGAPANTSLWRVERGPYQCSLNHVKGPKFTLELSDSLDRPTLLTFRLGSSEFQTSPAEVVLKPSGASFKGSSATWVPGGFAVFGLPQGFLDTFQTSAGLIVNVRDKKKFDYQFAPAADAIQTFKSCQNALLRSWGIDATKRLQRQPQPTESGSWIDQHELDRIATEAMARRGGGTTVITYLVKVDGSAADCRIALSSGLPTIDAFACQSVLRKGSFEPALNDNGKPVPTRIAEVLYFAFTRP